jgi:hypothetical protein
VERSAAQIGSLAEEELGALRVEALMHGPATHPYDPLALSEREDELQGWLEDHGIGQPWELAPVLASFGWKRDEVERLAIRFSPVKLPIVVRWLAASFSVYGLLAEVGQGAEAISEIVEAVKTYSYLDQAPIQEVDVRETLENSLVLLRPKLKMGVSIRRDYADDVPRVEAYGSELNQVWTNIIDNAIDAVQGKGELELSTYSADSTVVIEITDDGPGIPPEIRQRIFEPFFTTKGPGAGTGLGLHIAYNIVVHRHHGQIRVASTAGETRLRVILPVRLDRQ